MKRSSFLKSILFLPFAAKAAIESKVLTPITLVDEAGQVPNRIILMEIDMVDSFLEGARIGSGYHMIMAKPRQVGAVFAARIYEEQRLKSLIFEEKQ